MALATVNRNGLATLRAALTPTTAYVATNEMPTSGAQTTKAIAAAETAMDATSIEMFGQGSQDQVNWASLKSTADTVSLATVPAGTLGRIAFVYDTAGFKYFRAQVKVTGATGGTLAVYGLKGLADAKGT